MSLRTVTISSQIAGITITGTSRRGSTTDGGEENKQALLAAGSAGTLSTRTDDDTGTVTLSAGHGQATGVYDVYWSNGIRRSMAGTVTSNSLALDGGVGDNLPAQDTAVVVDEQQVLDLDYTAAEILLAVFGASRRGSVEFQESDESPILSLEVGRDNAGEAWAWRSTIDGATPFTADVGRVVVSNGSSAGTNQIKIGLAGD
jgi:hypothetical protein